MYIIVLGFKFIEFISSFRVQGFAVVRLYGFTLQAKGRFDL